MYRTEYAVADASVAHDFLDLRHGHGDLFGFGPSTWPWICPYLSDHRLQEPKLAWLLAFFRETSRVQLFWDVVYVLLKADESGSPWGYSFLERK